MSNIKVVVRARPLNSQRECDSSVLSMTKTSTTICMPSKRGPLFQSAEDTAVVNTLKTFNYDSCFWSSASNVDSSIAATQDQIFRDVGVDVLENAFDGYNSCIFAYGQTGSGKTYSMMGTPSQPGIIPRMATAIFDTIRKNEDSRIRFEVDICYMEIYNERVKDLIVPANKSFRVREHPTQGPYVDGLSTHRVTNVTDILALIATGSNARTVAETAMNDQSSRSHAILTFSITRIKYEPDLDITHQRTSKINLIDLAGSERANVSQTSGKRLKEGGNINKSLSTLGLVIKALVERTKLEASGKPGKVFVPYRDSILTWLLRECLGGNSKTVMLATVSPALEHADETLSTLRYADSAKRIINAAVVNEDPKAKMIEELLAEVQRLKMQLANAGNSDADLEIQKYRDEISSLKKMLHEKNEDMISIMKSDQDTKPDFKLLEGLNLDVSAKSLPDVSEATASIMKLEMSQQSMQMQQDVSNSPHLVNLTDDPLCSDVLIHFLKLGATKIGSSSAADIVLTSDLIDPVHCIVEMLANGLVFVSPSLSSGSDELSPVDDDLIRHLPHDSRESLFGQAPKCSTLYINGRKVEAKTRVTHASRILLGRTHLFRFNHPQEAYIIRQKRISELSSSQSGSVRSSTISEYSHDGSFCESRMSRRFSSVITADYISESESPTPMFESSLLVSAQEEMEGLEAEYDRKNIDKPPTTERETVLESFDPLPEPEHRPPTWFATPKPDSMVDWNAPPNVQVTIPDFALIEEEGVNSYYLFQIRVYYGHRGHNQEWGVRRRYSHMLAFHKQLRKEAPSLIADAFPLYSISEQLGSIIGIPSKKSIHGRRKKLETYFNALINWWISSRIEHGEEVASDILKTEFPVLDPSALYDGQAWIADD